MVQDAMNAIKAQDKDGSSLPDVYAQRLMFTKLPMEVKTRLQEKIKKTRALRSEKHLRQLLSQAVEEVYKIKR